jgi:molybdopterin converting factor subunit 1
MVVAASRRKHAHPTVIPWDLAATIPGLPDGWGVDRLLRQHAGRLVAIELDRPGLADEFNTPKDLDLWRHSTALRVKLRLFAIARERAGRGEIEVALPPSPSVADLRRAIATQHPSLAELAAKVRVAVDSDFADDDRPILAESELALIPPVSGG